MANFNILHEVTNGEEGDWRLCFQWGFYHYNDRPDENGYRFIWRREDGSLQSRPARIPSSDELDELINLAKKSGWYKVVEKK